ncbi:hypothetical protein D3C72_1225670 [compost metagenome]
MVPTVDEFFNQEYNIRRAKIAAILLYHVADYWFDENNNNYNNLSELHKYLIHECPDFLLIRYLADVSKHATLNTQKNIPRKLSSSDQVSRSPGLFDAPFGVGSFSEAVTVFAIMDDGDKKKVSPAIKSVKEMWTKIFVQ